jgi:hypothetical protein
MGHSHVVHCSTLFIDLLLFFWLNLRCCVGRPARARNVAAEVQLFQGYANQQPPIGDVAEQVGSNEELIAEIQGFRP